MLQATDCLPTGRDERTEIKEVIGAINKHLHTTEIVLLEDGKASMGAVFDTETLYCFQNNEHHEEGWLYNHIIGMLQHLETFDLDDGDTYILEMAIFWSDLGKLSTLKDSPKKTWPDGTPQSTAFGHDKASAKMLEEAAVSPEDSLYSRATSADYAIQWIVEEHMNAHQLSAMDEQGKTTIPDFLKSQVAGLDAWDWPEWSDLDIPHGESMGKKPYAWIRRGASKLLRIKQECDENGRISELNF
jgi:hypothetical protein